MADTVTDPSSSDTSSTALMRSFPLLVDLEASESVREDFFRRGFGAVIVAVCGTSHRTSLDQSLSLDADLRLDRLEERWDDAEEMVTAVMECLEWPLSEFTGVVARVEVLGVAEKMEWVSADSAVSDQASSSMAESTELQSSCLVGGVGSVSLKLGTAVGVTGVEGLE